MADDTRLKSSFELAMERLRQKDAEAGVTMRTLSDGEKAEIAEIKSLYEARIAEAEVMHLSHLQKALDPGARETLETQFRVERERLTRERDRKVEQIREGTR